MAKDNMTAATRAHQRRGIQVALGWISHSYQEQVGSWVDNVWLEGLSKEQRDEIGTAHPAICSIHDVNLLEELVAEGEFDGIESENRPLQLILNADIGLDDEQKGYLSQLAERPLRLYRVSDVQMNKSFTVERYPRDESEAITIEDSSANTVFDVGDIVGLRLMQSGDNWETSGAAYHIPINYVDDLLAQLEEAGEAGYSKTLTHYWLTLVSQHV